MLLHQILLGWSAVNILVASIRMISRVQVIFSKSAIDAVEGPALLPSNATAALTQCVEMALGASSNLDVDQDPVVDTQFTTVISGTADGSGIAIAAFQPDIFRRLRSLFGISEQEYVDSIFHSGSFVGFQSNSKGAARVGGSFFFTRDGSYMVKTIKPEEIDAVQAMLPKYYKFMKKNGKRTLLTRICGLYSVQVDGGRHVFIVMNAVFPPAAKALLTERFDIKGSIVGRRCSVAELEAKGKEAVLKDCDLLDEIAVLKSRARKKLGSRKQTIHSIELGIQKKTSLMAQLRRDVKLLAECNLIDYSLLVGVVDLDSDAILDSDSVDAIRRAQTVAYDMRLSEAQLVRRIALRTGSFAISTLTVPLRAVRWTAAWAKHVIIPRNFPYYGVERCNVDGGQLSVLRGKRKGQASIYYLGLIDFLQPFTTFKKIEWRYKQLRYGSGASCVPPEEYAERFLSFVEENFH